MKNRIIVGINGLAEDASKKIEEALADAGYPVEVIRKGTKDGVFMEASSDHNVTGVIVAMDLEGAKPYSVTELEGLCGLREDLTVIVMLQEKDRGTKLVKDLFSNGIYNALIGNDATFPKIAELLKKGRSRQAARLYYQLEQIGGDLAGIGGGRLELYQFKKYAAALMEELDEASFIDKLDYISNILGNQFKDFIVYLPEELKEKVRKTGKYDQYFPKKKEKKIKLSKPKVQRESEDKRGDDRAGEDSDEKSEQTSKSVKVKDVVEKINKVLISKVNDYLENQKNRKLEKEEERKLKAEAVSEKNDVATEQGEALLTDSSNDAVVISKKVKRERKNTNSLPEETLEKPKKSKRKGKVKDDCIPEEKEVSDLSIEEPSTEVKSTRKRKRAVITIPDNLTIAIFSFANGTGCTHMANAFALYVKNRKKKVCIVDFNKAIKTEEERFGVTVHSMSQIDDLYDMYDYIILDIGVRAEEKMVFPEIKRAGLKIVMANLDELYLEKLASGIRKNRETGSNYWKYVFNHIPKSKVKKVDALMEDYEHYCLPEVLFDVENPSMEAIEIMEHLIAGGKNK